MSSSSSQQSRSHGVPIRRDGFSVMDTEFDNIRERFDSEMRRMEDEMNKFRSEMMASMDGDVFKEHKSSKQSSCSSSSHSMTTKSESKKCVNGQEIKNEKSSFSSSSKSTDLLANSGLGDHSNWLQGLDSPLIQKSEEGQKELKLRFDVSQYQPEEIMVKTVDNKLLVHAKHEEKGEGKAVYREYNREFLLPAGTDPEVIKSSLSKDGILTVEAPLPQSAIAHEKQ